MPHGGPRVAGVPPFHALHVHYMEAEDHFGSAHMGRVPAALIALFLAIAAIARNTDEPPCLRDEGTELLHEQDAPRFRVTLNLMIWRHSTTGR